MFQTASSVIGSVQFGWNVVPLVRFCVLSDFVHSVSKECFTFLLVLDQSNTTQLSVQKRTWRKLHSKAFRTVRSKRTPKTEASSSSFETLRCLMEATRLLPRTKTR